MIILRSTQHVSHIFIEGPYTYDNIDIKELINNNSYTKNEIWAIAKGLLVFLAAHMDINHAVENEIIDFGQKYLESKSYRDLETCHDASAHLDNYENDLLNNILHLVTCNKL